MALTTASKASPRVLLPATGKQTIVAMISPAIASFLFIGLLLLRFRLIESKVRHAKLAFELAELLEVDGADNVHDGKLLRFGADHGEAFDLIALHHQIDFNVVAVFAAVDRDDPAPGAATKLRPHGLNFGLRILAFLLEREALDIDPLHAFENLLDVGVFFARENLG